MKGYLSFPFMTSIIETLDSPGEGDGMEEEEIMIDYSHYLVDPSSAF